MGRALAIAIRTGHLVLTLSNFVVGVFLIFVLWYPVGYYGIYCTVVAFLATVYVVTTFIPACAQRFSPVLVLVAEALQAVAWLVAVVLIGIRVFPPNCTNLSYSETETDSCGWATGTVTLNAVTMAYSIVNIVLVLWWTGRHTRTNTFELGALKPLEPYKRTLA